MSEKFKVEFDRKEVELEFYDPTDGERQAWLECLTRISSEKNKAYEGYETREKQEAAPPEKVTEWLKLASKITEEKEKIIFGIHKNGILKTTEDMKKLSLPCKKRIIDWFDEAIGIKTTKAEQDFTRN